MKRVRLSAVSFPAVKKFTFASGGERLYCQHISCHFGKTRKIRPISYPPRSHIGFRVDRRGSADELRDLVMSGVLRGVIH